MAEEKRATERSVVRYSVRVATPRDREFDGTIENLGTLGALVSTPDLEATLEVGDRVSLTIETPQGPLAASGEVLRVDQEFAAGDLSRTFAVRFDAPVEP